MSKVIILGDVHLGKSLNIGKAGIGASLNSRIVDQLNLLDWTLERAIEHNATDIIITGDIFEDPKPSSSLITLFISWLKNCIINNIRLHIIMGNHDMLKSGSIIYSSLDIIREIDTDNINIYNKIDTIIIDNSAFTLMPYSDRKILNCNSNDEAVKILEYSLVYELEYIPKTYNKVLIGHLAIEGSIPVGDEIDSLSDVLFMPLTIFSKYDYTFMGHVHKPQILKQKPYISHIGSMDLSNFLEYDQLKYIVIYDCEENVFETEYLPTRPLKKIIISVPENIKDSTNYVLSELKDMGDIFEKAIVKLEITLLSQDTKSINKTQIEKFLLSMNAFNICTISESRKIALIKKECNTIDTKMDVISAIKTFANLHIEESKRPMFLNTAINIYDKYKSEIK